MHPVKHLCITSVAWWHCWYIGQLTGWRAASSCIFVTACVNTRLWCQVGLMVNIAVRLRACCPCNEWGGVCLWLRWVTRSSRRGSWGNGWTAAWQKEACWRPCRRAPAAATTPWSPRWWRSGWTDTARSTPVPLSLTGRRMRMKMSEREKGRKTELVTRRLDARCSPSALDEYLTVNTLFFLSPQWKPWTCNNACYCEL